MNLLQKHDQIIRRNIFETDNPELESLFENEDFLDTIESLGLDDMREARQIYLLQEALKSVDNIRKKSYKMSLVEEDDLETNLSDSDDEDKEEWTKKDFHAIKEVIRKIILDHGETDILYDS